jgi:hypothetical protein
MAKGMRKPDGRCHGPVRQTWRKFGDFPKIWLSILHINPWGIHGVSMDYPWIIHPGWLPWRLSSIQVKPGTAPKINTLGH